MIAGSIHERAQAYKIPGIYVDGQDVLAVYQVAMQAAQRARSGAGPTLIETDTYRYSGHFIGEQTMVPAYRTDDELSEWLKRDPLVIFRSWLLENGVLPEPDLLAIETQVELEVSEAVQFAEASPWPDPQEALEDLFSVPAS